MIVDIGLTAGSGVAAAACVRQLALVPHFFMGGIRRSTWRTAIRVTAENIPGVTSVEDHVLDANQDPTDIFSQTDEPCYTRRTMLPGNHGIFDGDLLPSRSSRRAASVSKTSVSALGKAFDGK